MNSVDWGYYDKFEKVYEKYLPVRGEGETVATQAVTAVNKLVYMWYKNGDVYDDTHSMNRGFNDLSSYANWLHQNIIGADEILNKIEDASSDDDYEQILKEIADKVLTENFLKKYCDSPKVGSIYECNGPFRFVWVRSVKARAGR